MQKSFDCVKMVREIRDRHFEENKGKSRKEVIERYRQKAARFFEVKEAPAPYEKETQ
ncbi:MAG: hypothetical protein GX640_12340 [Fibrobacter sp.]|nr:hypothetical protein [Fibrobacter sp.]